MIYKIYLTFQPFEGKEIAFVNLSRHADMSDESARESVKVFMEKGVWTEDNTFYPPHRIAKIVLEN